MHRFPVAVLTVALVAAAAPLGAQSLLYRSANVGGTWVVAPGLVQFNFVHRFSVAPAPTHFVANAPTFTVATGVTAAVALGAEFATHSYIIGSAAGSLSSNETQVFARWRVRGGPEGSEGFHVALTPAYNLLAKSADGELAADWTRGAVTLEGAARLVGKPLGQSGARAAFGGGVVARVNRYVALSADVGSFVSPLNVLAAWSAALNLAIPGSPHTFSLEVSNALTGTIQGTSIGQRQRLYGFEFTIPLHLKRFAPWFHGSPRPTAAGAAAGPVAAEIQMAAYHFRADTITISPGQLVRWVNADPVEHTVTFDSGEPGSAPLPTNGSYVHRFATAGTYRYHCTPHPFMTGVVVVK
ncbi:MAG TPA: plastocyanin/azurin family copper-binding protein [Gemmatimonadales bacterium]|jgi:plastocyanin|nr:plastocyanin/azurin family copper-binding protein [Gemmatimonadales bacterium]